MEYAVAVHAKLDIEYRSKRTIKQEPGAAMVMRYNIHTVTKEDTQLQCYAFQIEHFANNVTGDCPTYQTFDCRVHQF